MPSCSYEDTSVPLDDNDSDEDELFHERQAESDGAENSEESDPDNVVGVTMTKALYFIWTKEWMGLESTIKH